MHLSFAHAAPPISTFNLEANTGSHASHAAHWQLIAVHINLGCIARRTCACRWWDPDRAERVWWWFGQVLRRDSWKIWWRSPGGTWHICWGWRQLRDDGLWLEVAVLEYEAGAEKEGSYEYKSKNWTKRKLCSHKFLGKLSCRRGR